MLTDLLKISVFAVGRFQLENKSRASTHSNSDAVPGLCGSVWKWGWCRASTCRWMAVSWKPMPPRRAAKRCGACSQKTQCTSGRYKYLAIHRDELARQRARELANTPEFAKAQRERKKVEALFAELKHQIGLRRLRLRRLKFVREQFFLAAAAQNIKRLVRFLSQPTTAIVPATA